MSVPPEVESLVAGAPLSAHVATSVDDRPHVAPVWYGYRDGRVYFTTGGRKLANLRRNPRVALSIERARGGDVDWNVTLLGTATVTDDAERMDWASDWIYDKYEDTDDPPPDAEPPPEDSDSTPADADSTSADADRSRDESRTDGGESGNGSESENEGEATGYALVEVDVASASLAVYE